MSDTADIQEYKDKLFDLYKRCRYNEIASNKLMGGYTNIERNIRFSTVGLITVSFGTGSISSLNTPILAPVWAVVTLGATVLSIYGLIRSSGEKLYHWFSVASKFRSKANEVEHYSGLVRLGRITEDELLAMWMTFTKAIEEILQHAGTELPNYCSKHQVVLDEELKRVLNSERKL